LLVLGYQVQDYEGVIEALRSGALKPEKMITSKIRVDRIAEDGFKPLLEEKDKHVKILVDLKA
jgi:threonine dehydrogenase-like Zn-dependent dehydrogenase